MKINVVKKARKEHTCGKCGKTIQVGEGYRWWQHAFSPITCRCLKCGSPRPSDLATSDKVQRYCQVTESIEDISSKIDACGIDGLEDLVQELISVLQEGVDEIRAVGEEYGESADNMEQAFTSGSSVIDEIRQNADTCETWADNMETAISELENLDFDDMECETCDGTGQMNCTECSGGITECDSCNGTGTVASNDGNTDCTACDGTGRITCPVCDGTETVECEDCNGTGQSEQDLIDQINSIVEDAMSETL